MAVFVDGGSASLPLDATLHSSIGAPSGEGGARHGDRRPRLVVEGREKGLAVGVTVRVGSVSYRVAASEPYRRSQLASLHRWNTVPRPTRSLAGLCWNSLEHYPLMERLVDRDDK